MVRKKRIFNGCLPKGSVILMLTLPLSGCASQYWNHRYRDALDVVTLTTGTGSGGVKVRCGPIGTGAFWEIPDRSMWSALLERVVVLNDVQRAEVVTGAWLRVCCSHSGR